MEENNNLNLESQLNELNIFSLRQLARQTGVVSPTSKKKSELIKEIVEITEGDKLPDKTKTKQGRPPKGVSYSLADVFVGNRTKPAGSFIFRQNLPDFSYDDNGMITKAGVVEILENNSAFLWVNEGLRYLKYFIPSQMITKYNIKLGDRLIAEVSDAKQLIVREIFNVNDVAVKELEFRGEDYNNIPHSSSKKEIALNYDGTDVMLGENLFIYGQDNNKNSEVVIDALLKSKADKKIYINVTLTEKNKDVLNKLDGVEKFTTSLVEDIETARHVVILAIERAKRIFEDGQDVIIAIDDLLSLTCVDEPNLPLTKTILSLSKCAQNGGSISIYAVSTNQPSLNIFEKLADKKLIVN